jgi:hypothetical protein
MSDRSRFWRAAGFRRGMTPILQFAASSNGAAMEKKEDTGLQGNQKARGVWEHRTGDRRLGENQLFGSFRVDPGMRVWTHGNPTDDALAVIASILDRPAEKPPPQPDDALAVIASILDKPAEKPPPQPVDNPGIPDQEIPVAPPPQPASVDVDIDVDGYVKLGPGPLDAIRFKWAARPVGDGNYFVDETIGDKSVPLTSGPMPKQEVIGFIDGRERDARRRFEALKSEMTGRGPAADPERRDQR